MPDGGTPRESLEAPSEVVEGRVERSARAPAAAATVVEAARYAGEVRSVAQLLATVPGVGLHSAGGPGQATTLSLRGAAADQSLILLDGIPLAGPGGGAVDLATLPASLLERMIVSRGVLGAQVGSGALGGVVELVPKAARGSDSRAQAQASYGSFGTAQLSADGSSGGLTAAFQLDRTAGDFDYQRQLTPELTGSPYQDETRANSDARRAAGLVRFSKQPGGGIEAGGIAQASAGERGLPGSIGSFTPHARVQDASWVAGARLQGPAGAARWALRAWARGSWLRLNGLQSLAGGCTPGDATCPASANRSLASRGEGELQAPLGDAQTLSAVLSGGGEGASGDGVGHRRRGLFSLALADEVQLFEGRLVLHPALRIETVGDARGASPALAAVARPFGAGLELRAGFGGSFRAPSLAELYLDQGGLLPNPSLEPEHAWSTEAGLAWRSSGATLSLGGFWSRYRNLIVYEQNPPARVKPFNVGAARIAGLEARAELLLPHAISVEASYTLLDTVNLRRSLSEQNQSLAYRAPHRLFVRGAHRGDRLEGYAEFDAVSSAPRNDYGTASIGGRLLLNAGLGVRLVATLWLDLEAANLLDDRKQQDLFQYPLPGFSLAAIARARL